VAAELNAILLEAFAYNFQNLLIDKICVFSLAKITLNINKKNYIFL
jgi:hypothetical protein